MGPMNYEVRAFSWEDINNYFDQIVEMQRENIYEFHYPEKEPKIEYIVAKLRELENYLNKGNSHFIGALKEGELCGYIWCYESVFLDEKRMNINSLFVREKDRQSGVGHLLVNEIKAICEWHNKMERLGVRTKTWTYKSGGSPCIPTRNE